MIKKLIQLISKEKQVAILVTACLHLIFFIGIMFGRSLVNPIPDKFNDQLIQLEFETPEEEPEIPIEVTKEPEIEQEITNQAQDLEATEFDDEISKTLEELDQDAAEARQQLIEEEELQETESGTENTPAKNSSQGFSKKGNKTPSKSKLNKDPNSLGPSKNSFITYRVMFRKCTVDPIPVYLCENSGKIVLNIWVNKKGRVSRAQVNTALSTPYDKCLWETAVTYAEKTRFTEYKYAGNEQGGSIIYEFQGQ
ncbi:MAG: hypothetical protein ACI8ZO_000633 [Flavobacteriales bacterium]|jgi:hypothetical protein